MNAATFARTAGGYTGSSPAMLDAFAKIQQAGIREARKAHYARKATIDAMKEKPGMFFNAIRPSLSTSEAIEDAKRVIFGFRNLPRWQQDNPARRDRVTEAKRSRVIARFFRRYGQRVWAIEVAA